MDEVKYNETQYEYYIWEGKANFCPDYEMLRKHKYHTLYEVYEDGQWKETRSIILPFLIRPATNEELENLRFSECL